MLELADAFKRIVRAKRKHKELKGVFVNWLNSNGVKLVQQDHEVAKYTWFVGIAQEPEEDIALLVGEILSQLRSALDFVAWQIYLSGGGSRDEKRSNHVYFPIVEDASKFAKAVKDKVPTAWPEAIQRLEAVQPFRQSGQNAVALPVLHGMNNPDKHRELSLIAVGAFTVEGAVPDRNDKYGMMMLVASPAPVLKFREGMALAHVFLYLGDKSMTREEHEAAPPCPWPTDITFDPPPPPKFNVAVRTQDNFEIELAALASLINYVESIVEAFRNLRVPPISSPKI